MPLVLFVANSFLLTIRLVAPLGFLATHLSFNLSVPLSFNLSVVPMAVLVVAASFLVAIRLVVPLGFLFPVAFLAGSGHQTLQVEIRGLLKLLALDLTPRGVLGLAFREGFGFWVWRLGPVVLGIGLRVG